MYKTQKFLQFEEDCCEAYRIMRREGHKLINLFMLMLSAGMPELNTEKDIEFLVTRFKFELSDQEATKNFRREIHRAINTFSRRFDNFNHNLKSIFL